MRSVPVLGVLTLLLLAGCEAAEQDAPPEADASVETPEADSAGAEAPVPEKDNADAVPSGADGQDAGSADADPVTSDYRWDLPVDFPVPKVPEDNPMSVAKVVLGRYLFYDKRLSENGTQSCASCHKQELAFTDGRATGLGATGESHIRGAMSLANVAYTTTMTWANPAVTTLEEQMLVPLFGADPVELGFEGREDILLTRIRSDEMYLELFAEAFPDAAEPIDLLHLTYAIASFERSLLSGTSPFDLYVAGDGDAISDSAKRGYELFHSEKFECFHCHGGHYFSDSETHAGKQFDEVAFHNTGLYNVDGRGSYPQGNGGLYESTGNPFDMGRFKAPTLRNVGVTAPYMHDGSIATLEEVVRHYAAGGRTIEDGPNAGVGSRNPYKAGTVPGFELTAEELEDIVSFLESLTDEAFLTDPRHADPWSPTE